MKKNFPKPKLDEIIVDINNIINDIVSNSTNNASDTGVFPKQRLEKLLEEQEYSLQTVEGFIKNANINDIYDLPFEIQAILLTKTLGGIRQNLEEKEADSEEQGSLMSKITSAHQLMQIPKTAIQTRETGQCRYIQLIQNVEETAIAKLPLTKLYPFAAKVLSVFIKSLAIKEEQKAQEEAEKQKTAEMRKNAAKKQLKQNLPSFMIIGGLTAIAVLLVKLIGLPIEIMFLLAIAIIIFGVIMGK